MKYREARRLALERAAAYLRDGDFYQIFGDAADGADQDVLQKAQEAATAAIKRLVDRK